jgi:hypothetical protein
MNSITSFHGIKTTGAAFETRFHRSRPLASLASFDFIRSPIFLGASID